MFGFRVHAAAALARWQDDHRREMRKRLKEAGVTEDGKLFVEDEAGGSNTDEAPVVAGSEEENGDENGMVVVDDTGAAAGAAAQELTPDEGEVA